MIGQSGGGGVFPSKQKIMVSCTSMVGLEGISRNYKTSNNNASALGTTQNWKLWSEMLNMHSHLQI